MHAFLQSLPAAADGSGPSRGWQLVCDERVNGPDDVAAGRVNILVSTPSARAGREQSFMVTQSRDGGSVRLVRSQLLEEGTRMTVGDAGDAADDTVRQRTLAQELFGHYREPAAQDSGTFPAGPPVTAAPGRLDPQAVARIHEDFGRPGQRL